MFEYHYWVCIEGREGKNIFVRNVMIIDRHKWGSVDDVAWSRKNYMEHNNVNSCTFLSVFYVGRKWTWKPVKEFVSNTVKALKALGV